MRLGRQETIPQYTASPETEVTANARAENACLTLKVPLGMFSSMSGVIFSQFYEIYPHVSRVHLFSMRQDFPSNYFCFDVCVQEHVHTCMGMGNDTFACHSLVTVHLLLRWCLSLAESFAK